MQDDKERVMLLKQRQSLIAERDTLSVQAKKEVAQEQAAYKAAEQAFNEARSRLMAAQAKATSATNKLTREIAAIERKLHALRPAALDELEAELSDELSRLAEWQPSSRSERRDFGHHRREVTTHSEYPSRRRRIDAIRSMQQKATNELPYESIATIAAEHKKLSKLPMVRLEAV